jgi:hypothetical protein
VPAGESEHGLSSQEDAVPPLTEWKMHRSEPPTAYVLEWAVVVDEAQAQPSAFPKRSAMIEEPDDCVFMQALPEVTL